MAQAGPERPEPARSPGSDGPPAAASSARAGGGAALTALVAFIARLEAGADRRPGLAALGLFAAYAALATGLYAQALHGPFVSDDFGYLVTHPYTEPLSWANVAAMFDPWGPAKLYAANYAPLHLLLTALERHIFADALLGYHLVNVLVHAANAGLLVALLRRAGVPGVAAVLGGGFFLVHPANVEAVAWVSQLKTSACLAFALAALLVLERRPAAATALFVASLLTKASGLFLLPTAAAWLWARGVPAQRFAWVAAWLVIAGLYAVPQLASFQHLGAVEVAAFEDPAVHVRTIFAVALRYLVMAATSLGVSAFQEPAPATSWLDPRWLGGALACTALAARTLAGLRPGAPRPLRLEAVFWIAAAAAFAPVSQVFPFLNPVADRYLYVALPGLVGGALLAGDALRRAAPTRGPLRAPRVGLAAALAACAVLGLLGLRTAERARLWTSETLLLLDAARHYPEGGTAHFLEARAAAQRGDVDAALDSLRVAADRGLDRFRALRRDPGLAPLRGEPAFDAFLAELAGRYIEVARRRGATTQSELRMLAFAHLERGENGRAARALERALEAGGPLDAVVREELERLRNDGAAGAGDGAP